MTLPSEIKEGNVAVVFDHGRLGPWEVVIGNDVIYRNNERPESCHRLARHINNALSPLIAQHTALCEAADKMAEALKQLNMECRMADNRGELAGEVDGGTMDNAEKALALYAALTGDEGEKSV